MNRTKLIAIVAMMLPVTQLTRAQTPAAAPKPAAPAKPAAAKPAAPKAAPVSRIDEIIAAVKANVSEADILDDLKSKNTPIALELADRTKLKTAGVSDTIIAAMRNPASIGTAAVAAVAPAAAPVAAVVAPVTPPPPAAPAPAPPVTTVSTVAPRSQKMRVGIANFKFSAQKGFDKDDRSTLQLLFGGPNSGVQDISTVGASISAQFINIVAQAGKLVPVAMGEENKTVEGLQDKNQSNRVKQGTGARTGLEQGTDALLTGDVTTWAHDDSGNNLCVGPFCKSGGKKKFVVVVTYRLLDAETNEFIATGKARGESERESKGWSAGMVGSGKQSKNIEEVIRAEALENCLKDLGEQMEKQAGNIRRHGRAAEGSVLQVAGSILTVGAGENDAVAVGDTFEVFRVTVLIDPRTKEPNTQREKVGEMAVASVTATSARGNYTGSAVQATTDFLAVKKVAAEQ